MELMIQGHSLVIARAGDDQARQRSERALESVNKRYDETFKRLGE